MLRGSKLNVGSNNEFMFTPLILYIPSFIIEKFIHLPSGIILSFGNLLLVASIQFLEIFQFIILGFSK